MTSEEHNKYIAYSFLAHGSFQLLMMLLMGVMFYFLFQPPLRPGDPGLPPAFFGIFFTIMFLIQAVFAAPSFVAAYALLKRKSWARIASIVAGVMAGMHVPIGTAACVYALWFFFGENWKSVYPQTAAGESIEPQQLRQADEWEWQDSAAEEFEFQPNRHTSPPDWR